MPLATLPPLGVAAGIDGVSYVSLEPPSCVQALPLAPDGGEAALRELHEAHLRLHFEGATADLAQAGYLWNTAFLAPSLWTQASPALTVLQPKLPEQASSSRVGYEEVSFEDLQAGASGAASLRRPHAAAGSREYVRGSLASLPFTPGGEAVEVVNTAALQAAAEASTGSWLRQLEAGCPTRVAAPGLSHGAFGAWAAPGPSEAPAASTNGGHSPADGATEHENAGEIVKSTMPSTAAAGGSSPAPGDQVTVTDLFAGVWLVAGEEGSEEVQATQAEQQVAAAAPPSILATVGNLPDADQLPGAVVEDVTATLTTDAVTASPVDQMLAASAGAPQGWQPELTTLAASHHRGKSEYEWALPGGFADLGERFDRLRPNMAHQFPFELDTFQKEAVLHLEAGDSVFVAAHTSAGKTVVAEYAFALATKHCTRAIYTSPIKTISNQKFRDFSSTFEVGLLTGDVSIRPESSCLIMTTEILRSMLYKGADIIRDIEWVVFDEVHYINDAERGVVWEEVIIMLPAHVNLILLSATVPNVMEFADWVGRTKRKHLYVSATSRRPVPLEHSLYYNGGLYTIARGERYLGEGAAEAKRAWKKKNAVPDTRKAAQQALPTGRGGFPAGPGGRAAGRGAPSGRGRGGGGAANFAAQLRGPSSGANSNSGLRSERAQWMELVTMLEKKQLLPVVVFVFSKKRCDSLADNLASLDLTAASDKSEIHVFIEQSLARLKGGDRELPQILRMREMLRRGLGVHHAGLLPIMKEVVEMLFCRGLIKVLFSTETFAMGVNAPARTVVFQSLRKHDGKSFRQLLSGEYTQMAGRAGRRGLDAVGTVLLACWEDVPDEADLRRLLTGAATKLESQFRLTYAMILNLLRVEDLKVEDMLKRSFAEFHAQRAAPEALAALQRGRAALAALRARPWPPAFHGTTRAQVEEYYQVCTRIEELTASLQSAIMASRPAQQALVPGRAVLISDQQSGMTELAVVCGAAPEGTQPQQVAGPPDSAASKVFYMLSLHRPSPLDQQAQATSTPQGASTPAPLAADDAFSAGSGFVLRGKPGVGKRSARGPGVLPRMGEAGGLAWRLAAVPAAAVQSICKAKLKLDPDAILEDDSQQAVATAVTALSRLAEEAAAAQGDPPALDPVADLKLTQYELAGAVRERQRLLAARAAMPAHREPGLAHMYALVRSEALLVGRLERLAHQLSDANLQQMPEFHQRVKVLRQLGYASEDNTVQMKGRVACEIASGDELVATEMIFGGLLAELTPAEAVAILSAFVFQDKSEVEVAPTERLAAAREDLTALAWQAGEVQRQAGLDIVPTEYARTVLNFGLMQVVFEWAQGTPFHEICALTDVMEGSIVRTIVRLEEMCRQFRDAARVMGNTALFQQMEAASAAIKRDVIFAGSLYIA